MLKEKKASLQMKEQQKQRVAALLLHIHCGHAAILHPLHHKTDQKHSEFNCSNAEEAPAGTRGPEQLNT